MTRHLFNCLFYSSLLFSRSGLVHCLLQLAKLDSNKTISLKESKVTEILMNDIPTITRIYYIVIWLICQMHSSQTFKGTELIL